MSFEDVKPGDWYYRYVQWMFCHQVVNGYNATPPCSVPGATCFKPGNNTTRGQMAKIVVLAFGFRINTEGGPHFPDVAVGSAFYPYVETGYHLGIFSGYPNGLYGPSDLVTRGQLSKIAVNAAVLAYRGRWALLNPSTNTFEDVGVGTTFFRFIETAAAYGVVGGYRCGAAPAGPCVAPFNKPYFEPDGSATRAQISKIIFITSSYDR